MNIFSKIESENESFDYVNSVEIIDLRFIIVDNSVGAKTRTTENALYA